MAAVRYDQGKKYWMRMRTTTGGSPWEDQGEVTAVALTEAGARYSDVFTPEFMQANCPQ